MTSHSMAHHGICVDALEKWDMTEKIKKDSSEQKQDRNQPPQKPLTVEALEARIAPALISNKKSPDPPYPEGTRYGLVRRDNLQY